MCPAVSPEVRGDRAAARVCTSRHLSARPVAWAGAPAWRKDGPRTRRSRRTDAAVVGGIDISTPCVEVALRATGRAFPVPDDETRITPVVQRVRPLSPAGIVLDATGGVAGLLSGALATAGLPVAG
jgi:hypothetical protein